VSEAWQTVLLSGASSRRIPGLLATSLAPHTFFGKRSSCRWSSQPSENRRFRHSPQTCFEGPFGQLLRVTGEPVALENPFRFSTKYQDEQTDMQTLSSFTLMHGTKRRQ
jgi:hypothetical protein